MSRAVSRPNRRIEELEQQLNHLRNQQERTQRSLEILYTISLICRGCTTFRDLFEALSHELYTVFQFDACYLAVCDNRKAGFFRAALMVDEGIVEYEEDLPYGALTGYLIRRRRPLLVADLVVERYHLDLPVNEIDTFGHVEKPSRSWLGMPLLVGQDTVGVISIQSYQPGLYDDTHTELLQQIGNVIAVALENTLLYQQQQELSAALAAQVAARTKELATVSALAGELVLQQPLPILLDRALQMIVPLLGVQAGSVRLLDQERHDLVLVAQHGLPSSYRETTQRLPLEMSAAGKVVRENRASIFSNDLHGHMLGQDAFPFSMMLSVPLRVGKQVLGVLNLLSTEQREFGQQEVDLVQAIANQIAIAVENARLFEEQDRQIAELRAIGSISHAATTALSLPTLLRQVYDTLKSFLSIDVFAMLIYDAQRNIITDGISIDEDRAYNHWSHQPPPPDSLTAWILRNRTTLHLRNVAEEVASRPHLRMHVVGSGKPSASWLGAPLLDRNGQAIGVITIQCYTPNAFSERDERFLLNVAGQVALHVQNVRLLAQRERQIYELDAIGRVGQLVSASFSLDEIINGTYQALHQAVDAAVFFLALYDPGTDRITKAIFIEEGEQKPHDWQGSAPRRGSLTRWILDHRQPLIFYDLPNQQDELRALDLDPTPIGGELKVRSWIGVPLLAKDGEPIGVMSLQDGQPYRYDEQSIEFLSQIASHVSLGTQKVRLFNERERQIHERDVLNRISQAVTSTLDLQSVLERLHHGLGEIIDVRTSFIALYEAATNMLNFALCFDQGTPVSFMPMVLSERGVTSWAIRNRQSLLICTAEEAEEYTKGMVVQRVGPEDRIEQSYLVVPIIAGDEVLGVINIQSYEQNAFSQQDLTFVSTVAGHAAAAIHNARLFAAAQAHAAAAERQAHKMELLHRIGSVLSSRLNQREIVELAVRELVSLFWADHSGIVLFDEDNRWGTVIAEFPASGTLGMRLPLVGNPIIEQLHRLRRPVYISSIEHDPMAEPVRDVLRQINVVSLIIVPLVIRDRVIGSIGLDSIGSPRTFSEEEQELFITVATSIAAAIENARLFSAEQEARRTADTLREVARVLSTSFDPDQVLQLILRELQKVIPYDTASIMLVSGDMFRVAASRGVEKYGITDQPPIPIDQRSGAGLALKKRQPVVIPDTFNSPDWLPLDSSKRIRSWMGAPLISKGEVLGILNIDSCEPNRFSERDQDAVLAFANHAAIALENARLYQESVTRVEQEISIARQIQSNLFPRALPEIPGMTIAAECIPARETGGDFYDFVPLGESRLALMVGDASGKSIPAAMLMAIARSIARSEARDHETPQAVMRETNRWVAHDVPPNTFVALCYATLDLRRRQLSLANAGQLTPLLRRADGQLYYLEVPGPRLPLGIMPTMHYSALNLQLLSGDLLVFYTDGVIEARNRRGELFGFERFEALVSDHGHLPPAQLIDDLMWAISDFVGRTPQHDDMTLLAVRIE